MSDPIAATAADITADLPAEPYPGLRPFNPDEWAIFFGREPMIDEVIRLLAGQHLVVVHGASGCGKSSLVRAGVLPWLALDHAASGVPWRTAIARPAGGPLRNIAAELAEALGPPPGAAGDPAAAWHDRLALGRVALPDIQAALDAAGASLCLLVDQFEELFRWARENREEAQLVTELLRLIADGAVPRLFVILTMRSDYLGACAGFEGFAETVNRCQYLLPRMDDFALLRAIHEPAPLYGGERRGRGRRPAAVRGPARAGPAAGAAAHADARLPPRPRAARVWRGLDRHGRGRGGGRRCRRRSGGARRGGAGDVIAGGREPPQSRRMGVPHPHRPRRRGPPGPPPAQARRADRGRRRPRPASWPSSRRSARPAAASSPASQPGRLTDASEIDVSHEALIRRWPRLAERGA